MKLAIDGNEANHEQRVGSNVYAYGVLQALEKNLFADTEVTVLLSSEPVADLPRERTGWKYRVIGPRAVWTQWALPWHLFWNREHYDVLFTPGHYAPRLSPIPYISSVMDVAYLRYPEYFTQSDKMKLTRWTEYSVKHAAHIIAISNATKQDVIQYYGIPSQKISVAYPEVPADTTQLTPKAQRQVLFQLHVQEPYFLYIGTLQPRKNIAQLVVAYEEFRRRWAVARENKKNSAPQLVLAGKTGWLATSLTERIEASPFRDDILLTGFISAEQKMALLKHCQALLNISFYEGFGIPPLEALHTGAIPIVSNTSSLPEVVGQAGILVDPTDTSEIAHALFDVMTMKAKQRAMYRKAAREQVKQFNWDKTAQTIISAIEKNTTNA